MEDTYTNQNTFTHKRIADIIGIKYIDKCIVIRPIVEFI